MENARPISKESDNLKVAGLPRVAASATASAGTIVADPLSAKSSATEGPCSGQSMAVRFQVECAVSRPGQSLYVTGSHQVFGSWSTSKAVRLHTTAETFPVWHSDEISLPPGEMVEYKLVLQWECLEGPVVWEPFEGNRVLVPASRRVIEIKLNWGVMGAVEEERSKEENWFLSVPIVVVTGWDRADSTAGSVACSHRLARSGQRTMVVEPAGQVPGAAEFVGSTSVRLRCRKYKLRFFLRREFCDHEHWCDRVFVYHNAIGRGASGPLGCALLALGAIEAALRLDLAGQRYGEECVFLVDSWEAALVPVYLSHRYRRNGLMAKARSVLVTTDLSWQGCFSVADPRTFFGLGADATRDLALGDCVHLGKAAALCADGAVEPPSGAERLEEPGKSGELGEVGEKELQQEGVVERFVGALLQAAERATRSPAFWTGGLPQPAQ